MRILIIGAGGREHALAWKLSQSERVTEIFTAPGNGGTPNNVALSGDDLAGLRDLAREKEIDLTIVGPEAPLAAGIVDLFEEAGLQIWGPTKAAAQIEASKAFAKQFMARHNIPTGKFAAFDQFQPALTYLQEQEEPVVIKASGLAAGKGVILPKTPQEAEAALREIMLDKRFGAAGDTVLIEERLSGPEVSVLAFCDGNTAIWMPPAQDHKRAYDNDQGPNTGGMGAYAPAPVCPPELLHEIGQSVIQPTLDGLQAEGMPYVGVLYAGMMLTPSGPQVLEFNCRLGDPEAQVLLPLLQNDLLDIIEHSLTGTLGKLPARWSPKTAVTVVLASGGYPGSYEKGKLISGINEAEALDDLLVFHAGTHLTPSGAVLTNGGRVLNVTGLGPYLPQALERAYEGVDKIEFAGMEYRTDIAAKALPGVDLQ